MLHLILSDGLPPDYIGTNPWLNLAYFLAASLMAVLVESLRRYLKIWLDRMEDENDDKRKR